MLQASLATRRAVDRCSAARIRTSHGSSLC